MSRKEARAEDKAADKSSAVTEEQADASAEAPSAPQGAGADEATDEAVAAQPSEPQTTGSQAPLPDPLQTLQRERDQLQDRLMRLAAEFDNFRKRTEREWLEYRKRATSEVLREMIELVDNFERALESPAEDAEGLRKGVELIHQQLVDSLKKFGIEDISAEGMEFDPQKHEALMMVDSDAVDSQHVVQVIQKGYALNGEVLRPARVTVSR